MTFHRPLQVIDEARIPKTDTVEDVSSNPNDIPVSATQASEVAKGPEDDDEYDLALFRHSTAAPIPQNNATTTLTALASLESAESAEPILQKADLEPAGSSLLPNSLTSSIEGLSSIVEIRHLSLSDAYKPTKGVEGQILAIAVQSAFQTSEQIKHVIIQLDPKLEKAFRSQALQAGFRIIRNDVPLETGLEGKGFIDTLESVARRVWPLGYENELLMVDKDKWKKPRA